MPLPFTQDEFFDVFSNYNQAIWPGQLLIQLLALVATGAGLRGGRLGSRIAAAILGTFWVWMGVAYHWLYFAAINPAAGGFAALFVAEGAILLWLGVVRGGVELAWERSAKAWVGAALVGYSLLIYPLLNHVSGHPYPSTPTFGLPCPTTIFTLGIFHWSKRPVPWACAAIPLIWSVIGSSAAFLLDVLPDLGLLVAGLSFAVFRYRAR